MEKQIPFYSRSYTTVCHPADAVKADLSDPTAIARYLKSRCYGQDEYVEAAAMLVYNHNRGITTRLAVAGPTGCGKSYLWECVRDIYPKVIFVNSASLTSSGFRGESVYSFLHGVNPADPDAIVIFDEFDKLCMPKFSMTENISENLQTEFLMLVCGKQVPIQKKTEAGTLDLTIDTSHLSFVFAGSWGKSAKAIATEESSNGFGFGKQTKACKAYDRELTLEDLQAHGLIQELAGRINRLVNVRPLSLEEYKSLIKDSEASPIRRLEKQYGIRLSVSDAMLDEIATKAYSSSLGIRNATVQLERMVNDAVFKSFSQDHTCPEEIAL
ncbi:ATP-dependent protease Clp, ATPase subunit [Ruminococcaceae bacterium YRB3002]|nr:ATP-dependent protease Clp, ATPase subunit [Ruminococcaceae bacterium YRB3002]